VTHDSYQSDFIYDLVKMEGRIKNIYFSKLISFKETIIIIEGAYMTDKVKRERGQ
jgi:hypothetical protein